MKKHRTFYKLSVFTMLLSLLIFGSSIAQAEIKQNSEPSKKIMVTIYQEGGYSLYVQYTDPITDGLKATGSYGVGSIFKFQTKAMSYIYPHANGEIREIEKIKIDGSQPEVKVKCWGTVFYPVCKVV